MGFFICMHFSLSFNLCFSRATELKKISRLWARLYRGLTTAQVANNQDIQF